MTQSFSPLGEVLAQALRLSTKERMQLIERVAASVETEMTASEPQSVAQHWGKSLNALMKTLDMSEWDAIDDPEAWLKAQRDEQMRRRLGAAE